MINKILEYIKKEKILKGSIILISTTLVLYICNYFYHFYTARVLGPEDYSIIGVLFSLTYIIFIPYNSIQIGITKFVSEFNTKNEFGKIKFLFVKSMKKLFFYSIILTILFILISPGLSKFLNIPQTTPLIILGFVILFSLLIPITRGILQGSQSFKKLGLNMAFEGLAKIFFVVLFLSIGLGVNGAVLAIVLSFGFAFIISLWQLKSIFKYEEKSFDTKQVYFYSWPVLLTFLCFTLIYSLDILLVKHFFGAVEAGYYTALSFLGKIVFFLNFPIIQVMFPVISEENAINKDKKPLSRLLYKSFFIIFIISFIIILSYFLFPNLIVKILFGEKFLEISKLIGLFGIFMGLISFCHLFAFYNLCLNKRTFIPILIFGVILELVLISLFHNTLSQIVFSLIFLTFLLSISLGIYTKFVK